MKRRALLQCIVSAAAVLPFERIRLLAQPRELTPDALAMLRAVAPTVLPGSLGPARIGEIVDRFAAWIRGYRENVPVAHGYGHPRLQKTPASPAPKYIAQLAALDAEARAKGAAWPALDLESRRSLLEAAFTKAGVRGLAQRPNGQHVVADLMAFYFRSTEANDYCYSALIQREVCRPIAITTKRPAPLAGHDDKRRERGERREPILQDSASSAVSALTVVAEDPHAGS